MNNVVKKTKDKSKDISNYFLRKSSVKEIKVVPKNYVEIDCNENIFANPDEVVAKLEKSSNACAI